MISCVKIILISIDNVFNMRRFVSMDNLNNQAKVSHKLNLVLQLIPSIQVGS